MRPPGCYCTPEVGQHRADARLVGHHRRVIGVVSLGGDGRAFDVVHVGLAQ